MKLYTGEYIIDDGTPTHLTHGVKVAGKTMMRGLVPRDLSVSPMTMFGAPPSEMKELTDEEIDDCIADGERDKSFISHLLLDSGIPSTDQNGQGYCWVYSVTGVVQVILMIENYRSGLIWRLMRNCPYVVTGLRRAGFMGGWLSGLPGLSPAGRRT